MKKLVIAAALAAVLPVASAAAQDYPSRPVTMIVPFPAGGPADTLARLLGDRMKGSLGQPVIVENVTGAGASIGTGRAAAAPSDGYTLSLGNWTSHVGSGAFYKVAYDLLTDFEPVSLLTDAPLLIVGKNALPAKDGKELLAWLKANPDKASAATIGAGSAAHLCLVYFQSQTGTRFALVPYRGGAPVMQDLVANQIDLFCAEASQTREHLRAGRMKAFAVMAKSRWFGAPEVETIDEIGVPGVYISFWHGLWVPKGTPKPVIARLNAAVVDSLADPAVNKRLTDLGQIIWSREQQTPDALRAHHRGEIEKWWPIIKAANIKVEAN